MLGMFHTLIAPRYLRRYVGRHRARSEIGLITSLASASFAGTMSGAVTETFSEPLPAAALSSTGLSSAALSEPTAH